MKMAHRKERPDPNKSLVGFVVGNVHYAVPISAVREIVNPTTLTELPHLPEGLAGVADHRGEVIPIIDLRARFGLSLERDRSRVKWIVIEVAGRTVGIIVDQVTAVFGTGGEDVRPPPRLGVGEDLRGITGVISHDGVLTFVLEVERFETLMEAIPESALLAAAQAGPP